MGFYGNITNTSKTQFQFDKSFPNRTIMDRFIDNDGVYIGRFVLIEYDKQLSADWCTVAYLISDEYGIKHFFSSPSLEANSEYLYGNGNIVAGKYIRVPGSFNDINGERIVHNLDDPANEKDVLFLIVETENNLIPPNVENKTETSQKDFYNENYNIDLNTYGGGRGYDSTVWQKVFTEGIERYVMVAELNSVVPSFAVSVDAPTLSPVSPHFDADSTNVFYRVHWQPSWGMRVKSASPDITIRPINDAGQTVTGPFINMSEKLDNKLPSDETTIWTRSSYDTSSGQQINYYLHPEINPETYKITGEWKKDSGIIPETAKIPAAIYYNKEGFNPAVISYSDNNIFDKISIEPTGLSGQRYNEHNGLGSTSAQVDTQEISILLPSIGNSIASLWDIIYGNEEVNGSKYRNTYIEWSEGSILPNTNGLRLVTNDNTGYGYHPEQVETLAGAINSVFDLMGMIIQKKENLSINDITSDDLKFWNNQYIYYLNSEKKFYKKHKTYKYVQENITEINKEDYFNPLKFSEWPNEGYYILDYAANNPLDTQGNLLPNFIKEKEYNYDNIYFQNINTNNPIIKFEGGFFEPYKFYEYKPDLSIIDEKGNSILVNSYRVSLDKTFNKEKRYLNIVHERLSDNTRFWTEQGNYYTATFVEKENPTQTDLEDGILFIKTNDNKYYRPNTTQLDETLTYYTPLSFSIENEFNPEKQYFTVSKKVQGNTIYIEQIQYLLAENVNADNFKNNIYYYKINNEYYEASKYEEGIVYYTKKSVLIQAEGQTEIAAKDIIEITLRDIETPPVGGVYCYYHPKSLEGKDQYYILNKNNCSGLTKNLVVVYAQEVINIYEPNLYYYQIEDINNPFYGSYIFDTSDKPTEGRIYYSYDNVKVGERLDYSNNPIYEPNKYYYKDINNNYVLSTSKTYEADREYYKKDKLYVISDNNLVCPIGMEWNINVSAIPEGVVLGTRQDIWELQELEGFSRHFNTIHGLILNVNNLLESNNELIRDYETVQGSINKLKDIFAQFGELYSDQLVVTDKYGRITTTALEDDDWIYTNYKDKSNIEIKHQYIGEETGIGEHSVSGENIGRNLKFGEVFVSPSFNFKTDNRGHLNNFNTSTVELRIPTISYTDETKGNVVINMSMEGKDSSDITFVETRENVGNLTLEDYTFSSSNNITGIVSTDTINEAFDKINTLIDSLDYNIGDETKYISKITQENGKLEAVEKSITTSISTIQSGNVHNAVISPLGVYNYVNEITEGLLDGGDTYYISAIGRQNGKLKITKKTISTTIDENASHTSVVSPKAVYNYINALDSEKIGAENTYINSIEQINGKIKPTSKTIATEINENSLDNVPVSPKAVYNHIKNIIDTLDVSKEDTNLKYVSSVSQENGKINVELQSILSELNINNLQNAPITDRAIYNYLNNDYQITVKNIADEFITDEKIAKGISSFKSVLKDYEVVKNTEWYISLGLITEDTFNKYVTAGIDLYVKNINEDNYILSEVYNMENVYYKKAGWNIFSSDTINDYTISNIDNLTEAIIKLEYRMNMSLDTINMSNIKLLEGEENNTTITQLDTLNQVIAKLIYRIEKIEEQINN